MFSVRKHTAHIVNPILAFDLVDNEKFAKMFPTGNGSSLKVPIVETPFGFEQRRTWSNPDLYHEEVVDLESPFHLVHSSGSVFGRTVLVVGDQNAGKSTFLHAFVHAEDRNWTRLNSQLPILEAAFLNSRFLPEHNVPMDELPFIDTDIARTTVLVGMDDWNFLLDENGLAPEDTKCAALCLQLIEIGGDHLDRMMNLDSVQDAKLRRICGESLQLLAAADKVVFILNGAQLHRDPLARFEFLRQQNPRLELQVFLSREKSSDQCQELTDRLGLAPAAVLPFRILDSTGNLSVDGVIQALCSLVPMDKSVHHEETELVAEHLISFWRHWSKGFDGTSVQLWATAEDFLEHCQQDEHSHNHGAGNVVPLGSVVGQFELAARMLCERNFAIAQFSTLCSKFDIELRRANCPPQFWSASNTSVASDASVGIRFPLVPSLFDSYFGNREGLPAKFWLSRAPVVSQAVIDEIVALLTTQSSAEMFLILLDELILATGRELPVLKLPTSVFDQCMAKLEWSRSRAPHDGDGRLLVSIELVV